MDEAASDEASHSETDSANDRAKRKVSAVMSQPVPSQSQRKSGAGCYLRCCLET